MHIQANGIRMAYDLAGPEGAPVVVLSHSLGSSSVMWAPQIPALTRRYRVLSYDTRGHGGTEVPDGPYTLELLVDDALALLDALGMERVHWVGLSMGGMIGQGVALRAPERLRSLGLCDTSARVPPEARGIWDERIATARAGGMKPLTESTMQRWFTPGYLGSNPPGVASIRRQFEATAPAGFLGCCHAIRDLDYLDRLGAIRLPTIIIVGEHDAGTPVAASRAIHERIPDSELVILESASHLSNIEQPEAFTEALLGFLDRQ
jgi:3-oxoadipate enol-lactonase